jgi:CubicO group peptidase (beta-lactamase class C family)
MNRNYNLTIGLILISTIFTLSTTAHAQRWHKKIDNIYKEFNSSDSAGAVVHIVRDGKIEFSKGYGMANFDKNIPISPTIVFNIASISKQITAASIAMLARDGKLDLDADVRTLSDHVPDYGHVITIRHLIHHTSGLADVTWGFDPRAEIYKNGWGNADVLPRLNELELHFAPGEKYEYSNTNYILLADIVQKVSGKTMREFANEHIFKPLGMTDTRIDDDLTHLEDDNVALSYHRKGDVWEKQERNDYLLGDGNVVTSVLDFTKWSENFHNYTLGKDFTKSLLETRPLNGGRKNR